MPVTKDYYELLGIEPAASADDIKRAFRQQIARYHPDKVQHLGKEFQAMAADRAAELTEAYRVLSTVELREQYDRSRGDTVAAPPPPPSPAPESERKPQPESDRKPQPAAGEPPPPGEPTPATGPGSQFTHERATRDQFVRDATMSRFRQALAGLGGGYDESPVRGFDLAWVPKAKLFSRAKGPRLLMRFVPRVDRGAVGETWMAAAKWNAAGQEDVSVFLVGSALAPPRELADAIHEQRRKVAKGPKITLIPVDMRDWEAHIPIDAPAVVKNLLTRIRTGA